MRFYFDDFPAVEDEKIFSSYSKGDGDPLFSSIILEWFKEHDMNPYFISKTMDGRQIKRKVTNMNFDHYYQTNSDFDSIFFSNDSDGILFKLTWL